MQRERPVRSAFQTGTNQRTRFGRRRWASLLGKGEACGTTIGPKPKRRTPHPVWGTPSMVGDGMVGRLGAVIREAAARTRTEFIPASVGRRTARGGVRASIRAMKRGNARGAKGRRKVDVRRTQRRTINRCQCPAQAARLSKSETSSTVGGGWNRRCARRAC